MNFAFLCEAVYYELLFSLTNGLIGSFWMSMTNKRDFFNRFAELHNFDPLVASNWYNVTREQIVAVKVFLRILCWVNAAQGAFPILQQYEGDYLAALADIYPGIGLLKEEFSSCISIAIFCTLLALTAVQGATGRILTAGNSFLATLQINVALIRWYLKIGTASRANKFWNTR